MNSRSERNARRSEERNVAAFTNQLHFNPFISIPYANWMDGNKMNWFHAPRVKWITKRSCAAASQSIHFITLRSLLCFHFRSCLISLITQFHAAPISRSNEMRWVDFVDWWFVSILNECAPGVPLLLASSLIHERMNGIIYSNFILIKNGTICIWTE